MGGIRDSGSGHKYKGVQNTQSHTVNFKWSKVAFGIHVINICWLNVSIILTPDVSGFGLVSHLQVTCKKQ